MRRELSRRRRACVAASSFADAHEFIRKVRCMTESNSPLKKFRCGGWLGVAIVLLAATTSSARQAQTSASPQTAGQAASPSTAHPELDDLAAKVSTAMKNDRQDRHDRQGAESFLVVNFSEQDRKPSELSLKLAGDFAEELRRQASDMSEVDRQDYLRAAAQDKVSADTLPNPGVSNCYGTQLGARFDVAGNLTQKNDAVALEISVYHNRDHKKIFEASASLPITPEFRALLGTPALASAMPSSSSSTNNEDVEVDAPTAGRNGYTNPSCLYCQYAAFTEEATAAKTQGVVLLMTEITKDGDAGRISVVHGLPCGLNQTAIAAVSHWKFKPALGPDGKPATTKVPIEVEFRLY
jgi:TonB family protein